MKLYGLVAHLVLTGWVEKTSLRQRQGEEKRPTEAAGTRAADRAVPGRKKKKRRGKQKLKISKLLPGNHWVHAVPSIWLKAYVSQIEGRKSRLAGPGACLKNLIHRMGASVESPRGTHPADFVGGDPEVWPVTMSEPDAR